MEKITAETMRSYNRRQIFNHIYFNKRSSRQEIADTLHLSLTTVTHEIRVRFAAVRACSFSSGHGLAHGRTKVRCIQLCQHV